MYFLIYSSYARSEFNHADLEALLLQAREKNRQCGVSGMLLYINGHFIQLLEGAEAAVKSLYFKINQDNRHTGVVLLTEGVSNGQLFKDWSMAFKSVTAEELASGSGFEKVNSVSALQVFKKLSSDF